MAAAAERRPAEARQEVPATAGMQAKAERIRGAGRCVLVACEDANGNVRLRPWRCEPGEISRLRGKVDEAGLVFDSKDFEQGEE